MAHICRLGKGFVTRPGPRGSVAPVIPPCLVLGLILAALPMVGIPTNQARAAAGAASAAPDPEKPWRLLVQGRGPEALAAARAQGGALGAWIQIAAMEPADRSHAEAQPAAVAAAARLFEDGDYAAAAEALPQAAAAVAPADLAGRIHLQLRLGFVYVELGEIAAADSVLTLAVTQAQTAGLPLSEAYGLQHRGRARLRLRQIDPPREDFEAALALATAQGLPRWQGDAALARSVVDRLQMDLEGALTWRRRALAWYQEAGDRAGQARALHYIGVVDIMQGRLARALAGFHEALALARSAGDEAEQGVILGEMASVNYLLGDFAAALQQYREAIRLVANPRTQGMMMSNIGSIHEYRGEFEEAGRVLREALGFIRQGGDPRNEAMVLMSLGETLCELRQFDEGLATLDQALGLAREYEIPMTEAWALKCKGHGLLDRGDLKGAAAALQEAVVVARSIGYFEILEWSLLGQAMVARREGRPQDALRHLQEALAEVAEVRRRSSEATDVASGVTSQAAGIYAKTIDVLYELHQADPGRGLDGQAFTVAQDAKARTFLNLLAEAEFDLNVSAVPGYRQQESGILTRIVGLEQRLAQGTGTAVPADTLGSLRARLAAAEDELQVLEARLRAEDPRYAEVLYPTPLTMADMAAKVLRPGELFLDYAVGDSATYLWAIATDRTRFVRLRSRRELAPQVEGLLPLLADYNLTGGDPAWLVPACRDLYLALLEPVQDMLDGADRLVVSPDGILHYLPFEVLLTRQAAATRCGELPFLVRQKVVTVTPSASVLAKVRSRPAVPANAPWLLVGDPVLVSAQEAQLFAKAAGASDLPALAHVGAELEQLARLAPGGRQQTLRGPQAGLAGLKAAGGRGPHSLIHLATHGLFNESRPRYSGLVLSPDPGAGEDGFLSVSEVFALSLDCDQIVLAACASGLGQQVSGEGLVGLTRSFMFAGARSVVAALWDVGSEATAMFMSDFYRRLAAGSGGDRALALAQVKRAMIDGGLGPLDPGSRDPGSQGPRSLGQGLDTAHPAFWAGFVLSGDGGPR